MQRLGRNTIFLIIVVFILNLFAFPVCAVKGGHSPLIIVLDPGHGGNEDGAYYYGLKEKDVNLKLAKMVKQELEKYPNVSVVLTREDDEEIGLSERARRAAEADADILLSMHCNASASHKSTGASVYVSTGEGKRENLRKFADYLLGEFEAVGLQNAGTFARVTQMGGRRADGSFDDYYGILRHAYQNGMPAMIIEHCYMDSEPDRQFLRSEKGLQELAQADVNGIAAYYGLEKSDGTKVMPKHAKVYGGTTKAIENDYFEAPNVTGIRLVEYDGKTPGIAGYEISVEDGTGIHSIYLVYKNEDTQNSVTISLKQAESLTTGTYQLKGYVPEYLSPGNYRLSYIGAYNESGYDAGYNYAGGSMIGFGKCDWLNQFTYKGEADFCVEQAGSISTAHKKLMDYEIQIGLRKKGNLYPVSFYPN